ncbi:MAG: hypothetical protein WCK58_18380, partial [Chloroflexota bacterium]
RIAGRTGGALILGGCAALVAGVATGATGPAGPDGTPLRDTGMLLLVAGLVLVGSGAGVVGLAGPEPLGGRRVRVGLGVAAAGLMSLAICIVTPIDPGSNSLASMQYVVAGGFGFLGIGIGTLVTVVALLRATGGPRRLGGTFLVGLVVMLGCSLLANGVIHLGSLRSAVEFLVTVGGSVMLASVAGLGLVAIRGDRPGRAPAA